MSKRHRQASAVGSPHKTHPSVSNQKTNRPTYTTLYVTLNNNKPCTLMPRPSAMHQACAPGRGAVCALCIGLCSGLLHMVGMGLRGGVPKLIPIRHTQATKAATHAKVTWWLEPKISNTFCDPNSKAGLGARGELRLHAV